MNANPINEELKKKIDYKVAQISAVAKAVFYKIRRRRWLNEDQGLAVFTDGASRKRNAFDTGIFEFSKVLLRHQTDRPFGRDIPVWTETFRKKVSHPMANILSCN